MTSLIELYNTLHAIEVTVPASEMLLLMIVLVGCLAFKTTRIGLMIGFLCAYRWGWMAFKEGLAGTMPMFIYLYFGFGAAVVLLAVFLWMITDER
ncbi:MAG: hypothetical protein V1929_10255 [bacterium]